MEMDEDLKPEGEGSFKNGPNYLVDTPSQNDLGSSNLTNDKIKAVKKTKKPAYDSGDKKIAKWQKKKPSPKRQAVASIR